MLAILGKMRSKMGQRPYLVWINPDPPVRLVNPFVWFGLWQGYWMVTSLSAVLTVGMVFLRNNDW
jgi:hypothetical protein